MIQPDNDTAELELKDIVTSNASFGPIEIEIIARRIGEDYSRFVVLRDLTAQLAQQEHRSPATSTRLGVCLYFLGRYESAVQTLESADAGAVAYFYQGKCHLALKRLDRAVECYEAARTAGYDANICRLAVAEIKRMKGDCQAAMDILDNMFGAIEQTAEYLFQRGATVAAMGMNRAEAVALYQRAIDADPNHSGALFGLAMECDRSGDDPKALELYQRAANVFPANVGALLNLGILYEDRGEYLRAKRCYDRILESFPAHPRAVLFRRDSMASMDETYDFDEQKKEEFIAQVLKIPVSQFELSVRSRNCLQKMGLVTLGDLTRVSESELLSSKNFGETSLTEIKEMLANKGLSLGQFADLKAEEEPIDFATMSPDEQALLERPISELGLSVRARKCMTRLGLNTIGELIRKTGDDLLECKNFGVTSLNEVRQALTQVGLKLRGD
jgi:DNA-directed RNA polymerase subunit alpha